MSRQQGVVVWLTLCLLMSASLVLLTVGGTRQPMSQIHLLHTQAALSRAHQALLAYAQQPLGLTLCESSCPRPGDLPCPDRNADGVAESSCRLSSQRLGRLPWKTLGIGELRDGSGEWLWYAVSNAYKNNPRLLPLNTDTPGSWSVRDVNGVHDDASAGNGVVAVILAPMAPLQRSDGLLQTRLPHQTQLANHYLDVFMGQDNAQAIELATNGFIAVPPQANFNDMLRVVTASQMHRAMQQQVLATLIPQLRCQSGSCASLPAVAHVEDLSCLGAASILGGCLSTTRPSAAIGRLPLAQDGNWPLPQATMLDGLARHHWFQQNGWREQVFYQVMGTQFTLVIAGEALAGQARSLATDKASLGAYLEASTLQALGETSVGASSLPSNDLVWRMIGS